MQLCGAVAQEREHGRPLDRVSADVQERVDRQHPGIAARRRRLERGMDARRRLGVTAGECVARCFHRCGLDTGTLSTEVFEPRGEGSALLWSDRGDAAYRVCRRDRQRVPGDAQLRTLEGGECGVAVALTQAQRPQGACGMSAHLAGVDVRLLFMGELELELREPARSSSPRAR